MKTRTKWRSARKCIRRVNPDIARAAMDKHIDIMHSKGWQVSYEIYGMGNHGRYEIVTVFCK